MRRPHVVLCDDSDDVREILTISLRRAGVDTSPVADGKTAIAEILEHEPDAAIIDLGLTDMDGLEVARRLRACGCAVRLIALTGYVGDDMQQAARDAGFDRYLVKPASTRLLVGAIVDP